MIFEVDQKTRVAVENHFKGADRDKAIRALESGKTLHVGGCKMKAKRKMASEPKPAKPKPSLSEQNREPQKLKKEEDVS